MGNGIYGAVAGSVAALRQVEVVAQNLAHASTPGFKAEIARFEEKLTGQGDRQTRQVTATAPGVRLSQGAIRPTGNPLDVALTGDGFLVVDTGQGTRLTRSGRLVIGADGTLRTTVGHVVRGAGGGPITVPPGDVGGAGPLQIDATGTLSRGGVTFGTLERKSAPPEVLRREGAELFAATTGIDALPDAQGEVLQGHLEDANVNPVSAMTELITAQRSFDALQQAVKTYREVDGQSIHRLRA